MKSFKKNACVVAFKDLICRKLPNDISFDKDSYTENDYVILTRSQDVEYVRSREDIVDYDSIKSLSLNQLDKMITKVEKQLEPFYIQLSEVPFDERGDFINNHKKKRLFFTLDKVYYDLLHYRNNRDSEDLRINTAIDNIPHQLLRSESLFN